MGRNSGGGGRGGSGGGKSSPPPPVIRTQRELQLRYPTISFNSLSNAQKGAARRFASQYGVSVSQAGKYLNALFARQNGEISPSELKEIGFG